MRPDVATLRRLLRYEPETGKLYWLPRAPDLVAPGRNGSVIEAQRFNARHAGAEALNSSHRSGYLFGTIFGRHAAAHRVAWALHHGSWPHAMIDHINGNRSDNRAVNLRVVDAGGNARNAARRADNKSGRIGVYWRADNKKWGASIRHCGKLRHLGFFDTVAAAGAARSAAEAELGFHPNHGREA